MMKSVSHYSLLRICKGDYRKPLGWGEALSIVHMSQKHTARTCICKLNPRNCSLILFGTYRLLTAIASQNRR